jgi:hypothetical protein
MRPVERSEIVDYETYGDRRDGIRTQALAAKRLRRYLVGEFLCFLFENRETVRYQVQEMMRTERIVREEDILHEIQTYNELLGTDGELGCTLLIGIPDEAAREERLPRWMGLNDTLYMRLPDGTKVRPRYDSRQVGRGRLSSVQYLHFALGGVVPVAIGCDHSDPELTTELPLSADQQAALASDLAG